MFKTDFESFILFPVTTALNGTMVRLVRRYHLRGFDAIHISSALLFRESGSVPLHFACFDRLLNEAVSQEGLALAAQA